MFNKVTNLQRHTENSKSYIKRIQKTGESRLKWFLFKFSFEKEERRMLVYDLPIKREMKIQKSNPFLSQPDLSNSQNEGWKKVFRESREIKN